MTLRSPRLNPDQVILDNINKHESIADVYHTRHSEIFNPVEQARLSCAIGLACDAIKSSTRKALDFGCGEGNLTRHLLRYGCEVTTADVTPSFARMASNIDPLRTSPFILNGVDLSDFDSHSFDIVATYSVLHHVPDYLSIVSEMIRVLKPGGVLFIDHEASSEYWNPSKTLLAFQNETRERRSIKWYVSRLASTRWWLKKIKKLRNPRYSEEGDIHVWPDDHIEWDKIRSIMQDAGMEILVDKDYLLFRGHYDPKIYERYANLCSDVHLIVSRVPLRA